MTAPDFHLLELAARDDQHHERAHATDGEVGKATTTIWIGDHRAGARRGRTVVGSVKGKNSIRSVLIGFARLGLGAVPDFLTHCGRSP